MTTLRSRDAEAGTFGGTLDAIGEFNTGPGICREQEVAVEIDVIAEARDLRAGRDPEPGLHHAAEHHTETERACGVDHLEGRADASGLRQLDRHAVRGLGAVLDVRGL